MQNKIIDLDTLLARPRIKLNGREVEVKAVTARTLPLLKQVNESTDPEVLYSLAKEFVPELTPDEVDDISIKGIHAVLALAADNVEEVEALFADPQQTLKDQSSQPSA